MSQQEGHLVEVEGRNATKISIMSTKEFLAQNANNTKLGNRAFKCHMLHLIRTNPSEAEYHVII